MPKFLDEPDIRSLRPQRGSQATPEADAISGLAGIVDFIGGQVGKKRKQEAVIAKGEAIGEATTSILNLKEPLWCFANNQLNKAVLTPPI